MDLPDNIEEYLNFARKYGASDLHLTTGAKPHWRLNGVLSPIWEEASLIDLEKSNAYIEQLLNDERRESLLGQGHVDFAYNVGVDRYRVSLVKHRLGYGMVFRTIEVKAKTLSELGVHSQAFLDLCKYQNGIILVTGSMGMGKSSTMAALVEEVNQTRQDHILTLEDPVEFVYQSAKSQINQREIPIHTASFPRALKAALRQDPDVIVVGEMRDLETISLALTAAETGHLVIATLHTSSATSTLDRIMDVFPVEQREQIRMMLAESLRGVFCQQLIPKADGSGRAIAYELMLNNPAIANCIREGKTYMLRGVIQVSKNEGMQLMDEALDELSKANIISKEDFDFRVVDKDTYTGVNPANPAS